MENGTAYLISEPTHTPWWGQGIIANEGCHAMLNNEGDAPCKDGIRSEQQALASHYKNKGVSMVQIPFSPYLDLMYRHDGIYLTDGALTTVSKDGSPIAFESRFSASFRQPEALSLSNLLRLLGIPVSRIPNDARLEGGEVHYTPHDHHYFGGLFRANEKGHDTVVAKSKVAGEPVYIKSEGFHLDTILTPVLDARGQMIAVLAAKELIDSSSWDRLNKHCTDTNADLLELDSKDSIGTKSEEHRDGSYAANCLPLPGELVGNSPFQTPGIADYLKKKNIKHTTIPMPESAKSGGAAHCLTHQLPQINLTKMRNINFTINIFIHREVERVKDLLQHYPVPEKELPLLLRQLNTIEFEAFKSYAIDPHDIEELHMLRDRFTAKYREA